MRLPEQTPSAHLLLVLRITLALRNLVQSLKHNRYSNKITWKSVQLKMIYRRELCVSSSVCVCVLPPSCRGTSSHSPVCRAVGPPGRRGGPETARPGTGSPRGLSASSRPPAPPAWLRSPSGSAWAGPGLGWTCRGSAASEATGGRCGDCPEEKIYPWRLSCHR